jgi:hypothetical protein
MPHPHAANGIIRPRALKFNIGALGSIGRLDWKLD